MPNLDWRQWSLAIITVAAALLFLVSCMDALNDNERDRLEKEKFQHCIEADRVWVDGNCLPAEEVRG